MSCENGLVKNEFDFGWKKWQNPPIHAKLALKHQKGDILDVGCATCQIYEFLRINGWEGDYYGIDIEKYGDFEYPKGVKLIIGDASELEFPKVDTILLYNILEHINDPLGLLKKAINSSQENVLIYIPQRNEELWHSGVVDYHQLDKTHKHCGFSKEEICNIIDLAGGNITNYHEFGKVDATSLIALWNNPIPKIAFIILQRLFSSKIFYQEIWCEVVRK